MQYPPRLTLCSTGTSNGYTTEKLDSILSTLKPKSLLTVSSSLTNATVPPSLPKNLKLISSSSQETSDWTIPPLIRDGFSMIGSAVGGTTSAFYGFNHVMPIVRRRVKGPMWLHFLIGAPPVIVFSSACAGLAGGAVPAVAQLASSSYHAVVSSSSLPPPSSRDDK
ncbi:unnamed protein product, partial [Ilex paraguariensis]